MTGTKLGDTARIPVIIGCGQINDRAETGADGKDSLELMVAASRAAGADGGEGILYQTDWLGIVNQLSFPELTGTLVEGVSNALGLSPSTARETPSPTGDSPILLINEAANAIGRGEANVALIVGAEALRTAGKRRAEAAAAPAALGAEVSKGPYPKRTSITPQPRHAYGLITPTDVYPLFENAARARYGQTLAQAQAESGTIWAGMSDVAASNKHAWIRRSRTAAEITEPTAENRPIAFPYTKFQVANAAVNQGAAVIVTSLAVARRAGLNDERIIYVGRGAAAHEAADPLNRPDYASSASMAVSLTKTLELNAMSASDFDHMEIYSCFPIVPKMARRVLGIRADRTMTVFGGLTFGGGPIGNYMTHAAACMVEALRKKGTNGLLFANGGYATHNHTIVLTKTPQPAGTFPQDFDFQADADALRGDVPNMIGEYSGPATLETYTIVFDRNGAPKHGVVIARIDAATRAIAIVPSGDSDAIGRLREASADVHGAKGTLTARGGRNIWSFA
ncbi:acetyl-CoA acetyltransferase [Pontixanthobacter sp.]|uniref:acetyl-CoA acetyltransferase n=1 Tax=Pontixanthobacter sp. TaxID=2792078 RepID=UPI003C7CB210